MRNHLITGGSGFVGFALTKRLLDDPNNRIIHYDAFKHYVPLTKSRWLQYQAIRLAELEQWADRVVTVRGDINDRGLLRETLEIYEPDSVVHLAALPIASVCNRFPAEAVQNVFEGTYSVLEAVRQVPTRPRRLLHASSSMVYGDFLRDDHGNVIAAEEDQHCSPVGLYGATKLSAENLVRAYGRQFGIDFTIVRPSAVYGPTDCNRRVTELFLMRARSGFPLMLDNGGFHQLDFTYVDDLALGMALALDSDKAINETFNMTRGEGRSIAELAEVVAGIVPNTEVVSRAVQVFRPNRGALAIDKARDLLGFEPGYSLEEGMRLYHRYVQSLSNSMVDRESL